MLTNYVYGFIARARWVDGLLNDSDWSDSYESVQQNKIASFEQTTAAILDDPEEAMETKDKIYEDVDAADAIFRKLSDVLGLLAEPVEVGADFFEALSQASLFHYGIFNPMGPTWNVFSIARHPKHKFMLLCNRMLNPIGQSHQVLAVFSEDLSDDFADLLGEIFRQNGSSENPLLAGLPTWVVVPSDASAQLAEEAFRSYYEEHGDEGLGRQVANSELINHIADLFSTPPVSASTQATPYTNGWYYQPDWGWIWTSKTTFPFVYRSSSDGKTEGWLYFKEGSASPILFYSYATGSWVPLGG